MPSLRALLTLLRVGVADTIAYRGEFLLWMLTMTMPLISLALWTEVAAEGGAYGRSPAQFADYFLTVLVVRQVTGSWSNWLIGTEIRQGTLSMRLLRPIHPLWSWLADATAALPLRILFSLPVMFVIYFFFENPATESRLWILPSWVGAFLLTFWANVLIGLLAFWLQSQAGPFLFWQGILAIFSGYVVPLDLLPPWAERASYWLPFRYTLAFPVQATLGELSAAQALSSLAVQWGYVVVFFAATLWMFSRGVRRFEAYGA